MAVSDNRKLVVLDVDSTLINEEVIDLLAKRAGCEMQVSKITESAMAGKIDFEESLRKRVKLLTGLTSEVLNEVRDEITLTSGAKELIDHVKQNGCAIGLVSGGFVQVIKPLVEKLGIDHFRANNLEIIDGVITGKVTGKVIDRAAKALALKEYAKTESIPMHRTIAIGDGANDIDMIQEAGLGVAFCAKETLKEVADVSINKRDLREVIQYL